MDIHKPKPWHSLREFLKEYVIIVVGVLTALAAEQGVEWLHWQQKTRVGEMQITRELSASWLNAQERLSVADCLDRRLDQIEDRLLQPAGKWTPLPPMVSGNGSEMVFYGPGRNWSDDVWRSLVADGTIGHLPHDRQIRLGRLYDNIAKLDRWNQDQLQEIGELNVLRRPLSLDNQQRVGLAGSVERARIRASAFTSLARQGAETIPKLIQVTPAAKQAVVAEFPVATTCKSLGLL